MKAEAACSLCSRKTSESVFELRNSPILQNKLHRTTEAARAAPRVTARYFHCSACHFAFNPAFDPSPIDYVTYYNGQMESPAYRTYVDDVASDLATECGLDARSRVLEIGCGSGYFLSRLQAATGARVSGFDPAYRGEHGMQNNVQRRLFEARDVEGPFDLIVLRHCLEGLLNLTSFDELIRRGTLESSRLYLEITDLDHLLTERNPALLFHEYHSYFSARAADILLRQMGFRLQQVRSRFGGAYLGITACRAPTTFDLSNAYGGLEEVVRRHRKVVIWGASGRCISVLSHLAWDKDVVAFAVDVDPAKQGMFIPVTGQRILSPAEAVAFAPDLVIISNEVYAPEIRKQFAEQIPFVSLQGRFITA